MATTENNLELRNILWTAPDDVRLDVGEVAAGLRMSKKSVYKRTGASADDPIPSIRRGGRLLFRAGTVREWAKRREQNQ